MCGNPVHVKGVTDNVSSLRSEKLDPRLSINLLKLICYFVKELNVCKEYYRVKFI